jgi:hypothetical protein
MRAGRVLDMESHCKTEEMEMKDKLLESTIRAKKFLFLFETASLLLILHSLQVKQT